MKTIKVSETNHAWLESQGGKGDSFDEIITHLRETKDLDDEFDGKTIGVLQELVKTRPKLNDKLCTAYFIALGKLKTHKRIRDFIFDMLDDSIGRYLEQHSHLLT